MCSTGRPDEVCDVVGDGRVSWEQRLGGCDVEVSGDDGWRCSLRFTLAMHVCQARSVRRSSKICDLVELLSHLRTRHHQPTKHYSRRAEAVNLCRRAEAVNLRTPPPSHVSTSEPTNLSPPTNAMAEDNSAAWPQADQALSQEILDLVQQATQCVHHLRISSSQ